MVFRNSSVKSPTSCVSSVPIVLVGNKKDLHMERMISYDEGKRLAESWKAGFVEASAKQDDVSYFIFKQALMYRVT